MAHLAITARQKAHEHQYHDDPFHHIVRYRTSYGHAPPAPPRLGRIVGHPLYCRTNGCASFLEVDPTTGVATVPHLRVRPPDRTDRPPPRVVASQRDDGRRRHAKSTPSSLG